MTQSSSEFFLQWNTSSLVSHWGEFKNYVINKKPLVVAVQETIFLDTDSYNYNFNISGFSLYTHNNNVTPRNGGTALYISNHLLHHQINLVTTLDAVGVNIKIAQRELTILSIYLSPSDPFIPNHLTKLISQLSSPYLLLGDFNAHHRTWGCNYTSTRGTQLLNVMNSLDLIHLNDMTPTHTTMRNGEATHSVIDLALTTPNIAPLFTQHVGDDPFFSDHFPIHYQFNVPSGQTNFYSLPRWNFKKAD